ncbi:MAG: PfkB family carbohydrate kinase [Planctomycetes bacterium]|nr:PfkB family carbohydrate kinase [Planctomycetota bacterium]
MSVRFLTLTLHPAVDRVFAAARVTPGAIHEAALLREVPAGKGVNTARSLRGILAKKSARIDAAVWCGAGERAFFVRALKAEKIAARVLPRPVKTRLCVTVLEDGGRETHFKGAMPKPSRAECAALLKGLAHALRGAGGVIAVCGSAPPGTPPRVLSEVLNRLRAAKATLLVDANGPLLSAAGRAGVDGLKGNAREIAAWLGLRGSFSPRNSKHRARLLARLGDSSGKGPRSVLVTLGATGAFLATREGCWLARAPKVAKKLVRSSVGCGDAATAGWMLACAEARAPAQALCRAVAAGSAKVYSADPGDTKGDRFGECLGAICAVRLD